MAAAAGFTILDRAIPAATAGTMSAAPAQAIAAVTTPTHAPAITMAATNAEKAASLTVAKRLDALAKIADLEDVEDLSVERGNS